MLLAAARHDPKIRAWVIKEAAKAVTREIDQKRLQPLLEELKAMKDEKAAEEKQPQTASLLGRYKESLMNFKEPYPEELLRVARKVVWYDRPEQALSDGKNFLAHLMVYGSSADVEVVERYVGEEEFRAVLEQAPAGVFTSTAWERWHVRFGMPPRELPRRELPSETRPGGGSHATSEGMDKTIRKYTNFEEMKADEYRYWQSRPVHERMAAVSELTEEGYKLKGFKADAFRLHRTVVHFERPPR